MRRILTLCLLLLTAAGLTGVAHADAIAPGPLDLLLHGPIWLPVLLVAVAVSVTVLLLRKFRKRK